MEQHDISENIRELILQTENPRDRAELLILLRISDNLNRNTELTEGLTNNLGDLTRSFQTHEEKEMALINQGRGFLRGMVVVLTLLQITAGAVLSQVYSDIKSTQEVVQTLREKVSVLEVK